MVSRMREVLSEELDIISLSDGEVGALENQAKKILAKIPNSQVGGSLAKGTLIRRDKQDIDIFVVFPDEKSTKNLEKVLKKAKLKAKVKHGSRDYFQIEGKNVTFEIIPVVGNKKPGEADNVTDVSLQHVKYVKKKLSKDKKLADEIKLAKSFCHACGVYGAESYIKGFSGYALEILIIYFGSFEKFLKNVGNKKVIDPERYFRNEQQVLNDLNASKLQSPIVVVDPTYNFRNVVAGLSEETFYEFLSCAKKFLKAPSLKAFEKRKFDVSVLENLAKKRKGKLLKLSIKTDRQEGDIAGTKMKKFFDFVCKQLEKKEQQVIGKDFVYSGEGQESEGYIVVLPKKVIEVGGVPSWRKEAVKEFKKVRGARNVFIKSGKVYSKEKVSVEEVLKKADGVGAEMGARLSLLTK